MLSILEEYVIPDIANIIQDYSRDMTGFEIYKLIEKDIYVQFKQIGCIDHLVGYGFILFWLDEAYVNNEWQIGYYKVDNLKYITMMNPDAIDYMLTERYEMTTREHGNFFNLMNHMSPYDLRNIRRTDKDALIMHNMISSEDEEYTKLNHPENIQDSEHPYFDIELFHYNKDKKRQLNLDEFYRLTPFVEKIEEFVGEYLPLELFDLSLFL